MTVTFLQDDTLFKMKQQHPGLRINQKIPKIATPKQSFDPDFGFWDINIGKVSYLGPEKGLCEASGSNDMLRDTSMDIKKLTSFSHHFATRTHRPSLKALEIAA